MAVCLAPNGGVSHADEAPPRRLLVGTADGIAVLERATPAARWELVARPLAGLHISSLLYEPRRGGLFAGAHSGGLYASLDGGRTWALRLNGIAHPHVYSVARVERDGAVILYAGTEPAHLYQSADYGESWEELATLRAVPDADRWYFPGPPHLAHVKEVVADPSDSRVLYAGVEQGALLKSVDGGQTWRELAEYSKPTDYNYRDVHRLAIPPSDPRTLYMTAGDGVYRSRDGGETWTHLTDRSARVGYPDALALSPLDDRTIFVAGAAKDPPVWRQERTAQGGIVRSRDGGDTWESLERGLPPLRRANIEAMSTAAWPGGFALFMGTTAGDVFASEDGGETWDAIASDVGAVSKGNHYRDLL